ncbi:LysM peptidoglycan-binding domain-containing protein [Paenibacillus pinistramenti]|uniref:LysM peptidoglycan-binding domain-containing protein n=1 Tax=Paenibacillus pinistramenti TaxID=1768003 RepID=UPI001109AB8C|nr:LysM peptidoglycan-binding domain-containing protein [Paenibacillus pinistramenti]
MSDQSYGLRFDIYERVHLSAEETGIDELEEIELYPRIQVFSGEDYATLRGHLLLTGLYRGEGESRELSHLIPVEITVPLNRVNRLEDISVEIENFDVDLLNERSLNVTGVLSLQGIETAAAFTPAAQDWTNREYTVSYEQSDSFNLPNDPWITADASTLQADKQAAPESPAQAESSADFSSKEVYVSSSTAAQADDDLEFLEEEPGAAGGDPFTADSLTDFARFGQEEPEAFSFPQEALPKISFAALDQSSSQEQGGWSIFGDVPAQASASQEAVNEFESSAQEPSPSEFSSGFSSEIPVWRLDSPLAENAFQAGSANNAFAAEAAARRSEEPPKQTEAQQTAPQQTVPQQTVPKQTEEKQAPAAKEKGTEVKPAEENAPENVLPEQTAPEQENVLPGNLPAENNQAPSEENTAPEAEKPAEPKIALGSKNKPAASGSEHFGFSKLLHSFSKGKDSEDSRSQETEQPAEELYHTDREDRLWKQAFISSLDDASSFRKVRMVIVQREETIDEIADRYSVSARELLLHNRLSEQNISAGQILYLP